ncbi:MAG: TatD family hydrolase [Alcanivoracaceae bacterium]|nr:TatD family hydrolase [Alcanivoracaceae bacterium]
MIDAHIHLDDKRFDKDRHYLIKQALDAGIKQFITPAVTSSGFAKLKELSNHYPSIIPAYGLHPYFINQHKKNDIKYLDMWLSANKSCAVGECGLDYFLKDLDKDIQQFYFDAQIELAKKHHLPLILHARGAVDAVFCALKNANYYNAMIHSYNGSIEQTRQLIDKGVKFSFGGAIYNPNAHKLHKLVKYCPLDSIMFETDAPDQNSYPDFKLRNEPINLIKVINYYSQLTNHNLEQVKSQSSITCLHFFK